MKKIKNLMRFFITFFAIFVLGILGTYAGEKKKFELLTFECELIRGALGPTVKDAISINQIPLSFRNVPTHPEDPYRKLEPLPDESPIFDSLKTNILKWLSLKAWFLSTIALGVGMKYESFFEKEVFISEYVPLGSEEEDVFYVSTYNYAQHYGIWGPAYIMYQFSRSKKLGRSSHPFVFAEIKTPTIDFKIGRDGRLGLGLFAGYEPISDKGYIYAANGWHRFGKFEEKERHKLCEIKFNQVYAGINIETDNKSLDCDMGIKLFVAKYLRRTEVFDAGKDFDLRFNFKDTPLVFGIGLYIGGRKL